MAFKTLCTFLIMFFLTVTVRSDCDCEFSDSLEFSEDTMEFLGLESDISNFENITTRNNQNTNNIINNNTPQQKNVDLHALILDLQEKNKRLTRKIINFPKIFKRLLRNVVTTNHHQLPMMPQPYPQDKIIFVKPNKNDSSKSSSSSESSSEIESVTKESNSSESKIKSERKKITRKRRTKSTRNPEKTVFSNKYQSQKSYNQPRLERRKSSNYRINPQDLHETTNFRALSTDLKEDPRYLYHPKDNIEKHHLRIPRRSQRVNRSRGLNSRMSNTWKYRQWPNQEDQSRHNIKFRRQDRRGKSGIQLSHSSTRNCRRSYSY